MGTNCPKVNDLPLDKRLLSFLSLISFLALSAVLTSSHFCLYFSISFELCLSIGVITFSSISFMDDFILCFIAVRRKLCSTLDLTFSLFDERGEDSNSGELFCIGSKDCDRKVLVCEEIPSYLTSRFFPNSSFDFLRAFYSGLFCFYDFNMSWMNSLIWMKVELLERALHLSLLLIISSNGSFSCRLWINRRSFTVKSLSGLFSTNFSCGSG